MINYVVKGIALIGLVVFMFGCVSSEIPKAETVTTNKVEAYSMGTYTALFDTTLIKVSSVIRSIAADAKFTEVRRETTSRNCSFLYRDKQGTDCRIVATMQKQGQVKVSIKVGTTGARKSSQALMSEISARLSK